jgi:hypothetical protein
LLLNGILMRVGLDFTAFSSVTSYMALISGRIYPSWGVDKLLGRALTVAIIAALAAVIPAREAAQREPAEALHYVEVRNDPVIQNGTVTWDVTGAAHSFLRWR